MKDATQARSLIATIGDEVATRPAPRTVFEQMQKSALVALWAELLKLSELLENTRHRLVFIGKVGVGKTTAICHLLALTADREAKKANRRGVESAVTVTDDLMTTGSGFTTLCEVVVVPADMTELEIEPFSSLEVERIIRDFCLSVWTRTYPNSVGEGEQAGDQANFPPELVRAVRNMVKLSKSERAEDDAAVRLARDFGANGFEQFQASALGRANLDLRTETTFLCPSTETNPRGWIRKTFDNVNLARLDTVSIPRRITLRVDTNLLTPHMTQVEAVVDTKGVDAAQFNREDLDRYIRDDQRAFCILAEGFDTAPTDVAPLLQRHVTPEAPMSLWKFALMVIPRGSEPEKKVGGQGPVGDRDLGISLLRGQIDETLSSRGIRGLTVMFFDPLRHFEPIGVDYRRRLDSELTEISADRDEAWNAILDAIKLRKDKAAERVAQIEDSFQRIREGRGLNPTEETLVREARAKITEHRHISLVNADRFLELYRRLWEGPGSRHLMTLRAANNRFGYYQPRNIDVYYDAIPITEQLVRTAQRRPCSESSAM